MRILVLIIILLYYKMSNKYINYRNLDFNKLELSNCEFNEEKNVLYQK